MNQDLPGFREYEEQLMPGFDRVKEFNLDDLYDNFYFSENSNSVVGVNKGYDRFMKTGVETTGIQNKQLYVPGIQHLGKEPTKGTDLNSQELNSMWRSAVNKYPELGIKYGQLLPEDIEKRLEALNKLASYKKPGALRSIDERRFRHDVKKPVRPIEDKDVADPDYFSTDRLLRDLKAGAINSTAYLDMFINPGKSARERLSAAKEEGITSFFQPELTVFEQYDYAASPIYGYLGQKSPNVKARKEILEQRGGAWGIFGNLERNAASWSQAVEAGEVPLYTQFAIEVIGSPEELFLPGGIVLDILKSGARASAKKGFSTAEELTTVIKSGKAIEVKDIRKFYETLPDYSSVDTNYLVKLLDESIALRNIFVKELSTYASRSSDDIGILEVQARLNKVVKTPPRGGSIESFDELSPADLKELLYQSHALEQELYHSIDEIKKNLKGRDFVGGNFILEAETGTPFNSYLFNSMDMNRSIFGEKAVYASDSSYEHQPSITGGDTKKYKDLEIAPIHIENPLIIDSDTAWKTLLTEAGVYKNINPALGGGESSLIFNAKNTPIEVSQAIEKTIREAGYDGVIVRVSGAAKTPNPYMDELPTPKPDNTKVLRQTFGWDTVVKFDVDEALDPDDVDRTLAYILEVFDKNNSLTSKSGLPISDGDLAIKLGMTDAKLSLILDELSSKDLIKRSRNRNLDLSKPSEQSIDQRRVSQTIASDEATEIDKLRAAGMQDMLDAGERIPEVSQLREIGRGRFKTIDDAIRSFTSMDRAELENAAKESTRFNRYANDITSADPDLREGTLDWVMDRRDQLVDDWNMDEKIFEISDQGFMGAIVDENLLVKELNRIAEEASQTVASSRRAIDRKTNRLLDAEEQLIKRGQDALKRQDDIKTVIDDPIDDPNIPVTRESRSDLPDEYFDSSGNPISLSLIESELSKFKAIFDVDDKPTGGWGRTLSKALRVLSRNENVFNEQIVEFIDDFESLVDDFKEVERAGLTTEEFGAAKDDVFYEIKSYIDDLEPNQDFLYETRQLTDDVPTGEPTTDVTRRIEREPVEGNPPETDPKMAEVSEKAHVNNIELVEPKRTERIESIEFNTSSGGWRERIDSAEFNTQEYPNWKWSETDGRWYEDDVLYETVPPVTRRTPEVKQNPALPEASIEADYRIIPPGKGNVSNNLDGLFSDEPKKTLRQKMDDYHLRMMEQFNDQFYGLRKLQGLDDKGSPILRQPGGPEDLITILTRIPGASNAAMQRFKTFGNKLKIIAPNTLPEHINQYLAAKRQLEILALPGMKGRAIPGQIPNASKLARIIGKFPFVNTNTKEPLKWTKEMLERELEDMRYELSPEAWDELEAGAKVVLDEYRMIRERLVESGIIGRALADQFAREHAYYNPIQYAKQAYMGVDPDEQIVGSAKSFNVYDNDIRALSEEGPQMDVGMRRPLDLVGESFLRTEAKIIENDAAKAMIGLANATGAKGLKRLKDFEQADPKLAISYFENGKQITYNVPTWMKREAEYIRRTSTDDVGFWVGVINGISRSAFTTISPVFIPVNVLNDMLTAYVTRGILPSETAKVLARSWSESQQLQNEAHRLLMGYQARFYGEHKAKLPGSLGIHEGQVLGKKQYRRVVTDSFAGTFKTGFGITKIGEAAEQAPRRAFFVREMNKAIAKKTVVEGFARNSSEISVDELRQIHGIGEPTITPLDMFREGGIAGEGFNIPSRKQGIVEPDKFQKMIGKKVGFEYQYTTEEIAQMPVAKKAAADSVELTLNFARGGKFIKVLNQYVIFLNAAMEGIKLPFRSIRENPNSRIRIGSIMAGQVALTEYNLSYPEYQDIPSEERWGSVIVMLPSFKTDPATGRRIPNYISIVPRTREWALALAPITYHLEKSAIEYPTETASFLQQVVGASMPINEIPTPVLLKEAIQQWNNYDMFRDREIVPIEMQGKEASEQVMPWTSPTFRTLGEKMPWVSPIRAEHAFNSVFGGTGRVVTSGITDQIIEWMDPSLVSPETVDLVLKFEDLPDPVSRRKFYYELLPEQREEFNYELNKPDALTGLSSLPVVGGIVSGVSGRVAPGHHGDMRKRIEKAVGKETGIDPGHTRNVYVALREVGEKNHNAQQQDDMELLSNINEMTPEQWIENRRTRGSNYRASFNAQEDKFQNAAQFADPEKRQHYYNEVAKLGGLTNIDILKGKVLVGAYYAIELEEGKSREHRDLIDGSLSYIPDAISWDNYWTAKNDFLDSLTEEESAILESELKASMTPLEREYYDANKLMQPYLGLNSKIIKYISGDIDLDDIELTDESREVVEEMKKAVDRRNLEINLSTYSEFKNSQDPYQGKQQQGKLGDRNRYIAHIDQIISDVRKVERNQNYELEKALWIWGKVDRTYNQYLTQEVFDLGGYGDKGGGNISQRLKIDMEILKRLHGQYDLEPEPVGVR